MSEFEHLIIATESGKGRSFSALLLAYAVADSLWSGGGSGTTRPVWLTFASSPQEMGPFVANLREGRKATLGRNGRTRFELLRSAGYSFATQRHAEGSIVTAYLPSLFRLDPGMTDPSGICFVVLPPATTAVSPDVAAGAVVHVQRVRAEQDVAELKDEQVAALLPAAPLFAACLDRRSRAPLIPSLEFSVQLLVAMLDRGLASLSTPERAWDESWGRHRSLGFRTEGVERVGLAAGVACRTTHEALEALLADQVRAYFGAAERKAA